MANHGIESQNLATARDYLAALERGATADVIAGFLHPQVTFDELPNRLVPEGTRRDLASMLRGVEKGLARMASQCYQVTSATAVGDLVILEVEWTGELALPLGDGLPAGGSMRAHSAMFIEFRDGRISAQRNYDCFEPW